MFEWLWERIKGGFDAVNLTIAAIAGSLMGGLEIFGVAVHSWFEWLGYDILSTVGGLGSFLAEEVYDLAADALGWLATEAQQIAQEAGVEVDWDGIKTGIETFFDTAATVDWIIPVYSVFVALGTYLLGCFTIRLARTLVGWIPTIDW